MKKSIKDLGDIKGKTALVRVDINVPLDENKNVTDDTRIQAIVPTVNYLKEKISEINTEAFVNIKREEMYILKSNKYIPLYKGI